VTPHPYLSFAYKRNEYIDVNQPLPYPLHPNKYFSFHTPLRLNNLGHFGKDFSFKKPADVLRIACLGASTTANNIADDHQDYTYPGLLEEYLHKRFAELGCPKHVEVYNCGIGGWLSIDILIDFELNILPTRPDYIILYHGNNDLFAYLTPDFARDYSHARRNLGEVLPTIKRAYYFPKITFWHSYECLKDTVLGTGNIRNDLNRLIVKQKPDISREFHALDVEKQILKNILILCQYYDIRCILSSFVYYVYHDDPLRRKYEAGVQQENRCLRELAEEFQTIFVDQSELIPRENAYFVDAMHFTPEGMTLLAENFGNALIEDLKQRHEL
jgi:lysophospholipase L1-like esterase